MDRDSACFDLLIAAQYFLHSHGRGAFRENPRNSLHWADPCEQLVASDPVWTDWGHDACCLLASRRKKQRIRSNVSTFANLPPLVRAHVHHEHECIMSGNPSVKADGSLVPQQGGGGVSSPPVFHTCGRSQSLGCAARFRCFEDPAIAAHAVRRRLETSFEVRLPSVP